MPRVLLHPTTYDTVREAVDHAFEVFPQHLWGKRVLLKPNVLRSSAAREGIVTHPALLRAVVEKVESLGPAELVVGDNPGLFNYGDNEESFRQTGLLEAAKGYYRNIGLDSVQVPFTPELMPTVGVSRAVLDADVLISLPKFKTHGLTVLSGAIKNSYGILPGAQKARLHRAAGTPARFHEVIVDVFRLRVPDLFIVDGIVGMEGNGPASPDLRDLGLVLAADNAVALDAVIARLMGCDPGKLRFLQRARELGLGEHDLERIEILPERAALRPIPDFVLPPLGGEAILGNTAVQNLMHQKTQVRPKVDHALCTACGACIDQCPVDALAMVDGTPVVDADTCITCFCCQEICPEKAIALT